MNIIFWQNTLSIHQSALIRNLAEIYHVTLISENSISEKRQEHGWLLPDFGKAEVKIGPSEDTILKMFEDKENIHVFTGINSFKMVYKAFKLACKFKARIVIQSEPYNWVYGRVFLRKIKYMLLAMRYRNHVDGILGIGSKAINCYQKAGFIGNKIFDWAYFTEKSNTIPSNTSHNLPNLIFVGSLDDRKNLLPFLPLIKRHKKLFNKFSIYGSGCLEEQMRDFNDDKIVFFGNIPNSEISQKIRESDVLILPSKFDGWGAVVNEALMVGTRVLCSVNCGAADLVNENRGLVFELDFDDFERKFKEVIEKGKINELEREAIITWSLKSISGEIAADYLNKLFLYMYHNSNNEKPIAPWK